MLKSLLPFVWITPAVNAFDIAVRKLFNSNELWDIGIADDPKQFETNENGLYQGPISLMPYYAEQIGCLLWTPDVIDLFGETYARQILGDRIVNEENLGRYAQILNDLAGKEECIQLIGELQNASISIQVGQFDKTASLTDKSKWLFTEQDDTFRPSGVDIILSSSEGGFLTQDQVNYLVIVIQRYLPYNLPDVRISVVSLQRTNLFGVNNMMYEVIYPVQDYIRTE